MPSQPDNVGLAVGEEGADALGLVVEDAEQGASAATHLGIDGSKAVERFLNVRKLGMEGKQRCLEVVDKCIAPRFYRLADDIAAATLRLSWRDGGIGLFCRNGHRRLHNSYETSLQLLSNTFIYLYIL